MSTPAHPALPSPVACEPLDRMVGRAGGSLTLVPGEEQVSYPLPPHASGELCAFLRPHASATFASAFLARLPGGRVFGPGHVLSPDGRTIARDVSPDFGKPFEDHWLLAYKKIRPPVPVPGTTAVIATTLGAGYSHWLLEELPRLFALQPDFGGSLIAHAESARHRDALSLHGFSGRVIEPKRFAHHGCEQLIVPSIGRLTPTTVHALGQFTAPLHRPGAGSGELLYISREKARRRRVTNESELWEQLAARGFEKLYLEELTWSQQINAFRGAKVVVAPHGAGLANLVFCAAGTRVVEIFHRSWVNPCFWQLAALKGLDYRPVVLLSPEPLAQTLKANRSDIVADIAQVVAALRG